MKRALFSVLFWLAGLAAVYAVTDPECVRPIPDDLYEYKEAYVPQSFSFESFNWEVADVVVLFVLLTTAGLLSLKHHPRCRFTALSVVGLLYFGLLRGGCICPVGATTGFVMGMVHPELIGKLTAVLFLLPLVAAFFAGRVFCTSACPLGALQHLLSRRTPVQVSSRFNAVMRVLPFLMLLSVIWGALRGGLFIACRLDVYKPVFFTGHAWAGQLGDLARGTLTEPRLLLVGDLAAWLLLAVALVLGWFVPRPFCRFLCPYSVLLGFFARIGLRSRKIDVESCFSCIQCTHTCPAQAITSNILRTEVKVSDFHCFQCGRCDETCTGDALGSPTPFPPGSHIPNLGKIRKGPPVP